VQLSPDRCVHCLHLVPITLGQPATPAATTRPHLAPMVHSKHAAWLRPAMLWACALHCNVQWIHGRWHTRLQQIAASRPPCVAHWPKK
jgi:hypothetical protein